MGWLGVVSSQVDAQVDALYQIRLVRHRTVTN
jgi:hypothetical protein